MTQIDVDWLRGQGVRALMEAFSNADRCAYFVGGCVRNALLGAPVSDIDISTDARPAETVEIAQTAGFKAIPTGIEHGTITVVVDEEPFEITTFRKDVETDGRRAVVAFSDRMEDDAHRRDFTMNALYADAFGQVHDPLGGLADLRARRVRFIDDPHQRIREDYLRILRFFRFHAWYGDSDAGFDAEGLAACARHIDGLASLSRERVGAEIKKLLSAPDPAHAVGVMEQSGVLGAILPGATGRALFVLTETEASPDAIVRLAALGGQDVPDRLRLSKREARAYDLLRTLAGTAETPAEIAYRYGADVARGAVALRTAVLEMPVAPDVERCITLGKSAVFPVASRDLSDRVQGPALGKALADLEKEWIASGFSLDKTALLKLFEERHG